MIDPITTASAFETRFRSAPAVVIRAPGRANLIGEHTDYSLLPVLPIAIDRELVIAVGHADDGLVTGYSVGLQAQVRFAAGERVLEGWGRYAAAAIAELGTAARGRGTHVLINGDLPPASGLSSSSALTVGIVAALSVLWGLDLDRTTIADVAARAERRLGVETGGMDQAAISFGQAGQAMRIAFRPFEVRPVPLPAGMAVILASSGEDAPKAEELRVAYNARVVGTRLAAALLTEMVGLDQPDADAAVLADVIDIDVVDILAEDLPLRATPQDVARTTGQLLQRLTSLSHTQFEQKRAAPVRGPALHVLSEARRVDTMVAALEAGDLMAAGRLLNDSHASLRDNVGCSTTALNLVVKAMKNAGAYGARLTGAGFGGYAISLAPEESAQAVIDAAIGATGGPAFRVAAGDGWTRWL